MQVVRVSRRYQFVILVFVFFLAAAFTLVGCGPADDDSSPIDNVNTPADEQGYPPPRNTVEAPVESYPAPGETTGGILLALDKPLSEGDAVVSGVGPPGLPVFLLNITFMGEQLGSATIGEDGTFSIQVNPLPAGVRIGLAADFAAIELGPEDIQPGEGQISVPQVGIFYDSYVIIGD